LKTFAQSIALRAQGPPDENRAKRSGFGSRSRAVPRPPGSGWLRSAPRCASTISPLGWAWRTAAESVRDHQGKPAQDGEFGTGLASGMILGRTRNARGDRDRQAEEGRPRRALVQDQTYPASARQVAEGPQAEAESDRRTGSGFIGERPVEQSHGRGRDTRRGQPVGRPVGFRP